MPKIDPTTGCVVMTDGEFWVAEARREGRQPHEVMTEFYKEVAAQEEHERLQYFKADVALAFITAVIRNFCIDDEDESVYNPVKVLFVADVKHNSGIRFSGTRVLAQVVCDDGLIRWVLASRASWSGTMIEPPDEDSYFSWIPLIG